MIVDLLLKSNVLYTNVRKIRESITLPEGLLDNAEATTYIAEMCSQTVDGVFLNWNTIGDKQDEFLVPEVAMADSEIKKMLNEGGSTLKFRNANRNSCLDFDQSKNGQWISFPRGGNKQQQEVTGFVTKVRHKLQQLPSSSLQCYRRIDWENCHKKPLSFGVYIVGHLSTQEKTRVSQFLT